MIAPGLAAALAVALAAILAVALIATVAAERRRRGLRQRLAAIATSAARPVAPVDDAAVSLRKSGADSATSGFRLSPALQGRLDAALEATGDRLTLRSLVIAAAISGSVATCLAMGVFALASWATIAIAIAAALLGPVVVLRHAQHRFQKQFLALFPDALDLMVRAVRAGLPVLEAMTAAGRETADPVGIEFRRIIDEMLVGVEMEDVLQRAADRIRINDFRFFVVTLILQRRTGGSVGETLANLSNVLRRRKELRLKARALSSEARASAGVLAGLPFVAGAAVFLVNPSFISTLITDQRGRAILGVAMLSLVTGFAIMTAMIKKTLR